MTSFSKYKISKEDYLTDAKARAKAEGYNPDLLKLSDDGIHKLDYDGVPFGRHPYGDFLIWSILEKRGALPKGFATTKRDTYQKSHSRIKGKWKQNPNSPNQLSLKINW